MSEEETVRDASRRSISAQKIICIWRQTRRRRDRNVMGNKKNASGREASPSIPSDDSCGETPKSLHTERNHLLGLEV